MAVFAYKAIDVRQQLVAGTVAAETAALARQQLRDRGLAITELDSIQTNAVNWLRRALRQLKRGRLDADRVAELWRNLAMLLNAGVPLAVALETCRKQAHGTLELLLRQVQDAVRSGTAFPEALALHSELCDPVTVAMIRVGDQSGAMPTSLMELADHLGRKRATANRLATALIYPVILCLVGIGVVVFLMSYVVPQLIDVLDSAGRTLPWPTQALKTVSDFVVHNGIYAGVVGAILVALMAVIRRSRAGRMRIEWLELGIPLWGELVRKSQVARIATLLSTMLRVDVRFTEALRVVRQSLPHALYAAELASLEKQLEAGANIATPLRESRLIPPLVAHLLAVGQESGELPQMLVQIRDHYEREVQQSQARFLATLEPALILALAAVIGFVVFATLLPILETTKAVQ